MKYVLCANTPFVDGVLRTAIYDFQRGRLHFIPTFLSKILNTYNGKLSFYELRNKYKKYFIFFEFYEDYLVNNELVLFTNNPKEFNKVNYNWQIPYEITNSIVYINLKSTLSNYLKIIFEKLDFFNCQSIELRIINHLCLKTIDKIFDYLNASNIKSCKLIFEEDWYSELELKKIALFSPKIMMIIILNSFEKNICNFEINDVNIILKKSTNANIYIEGRPSVSFENLNINCFSEALQYNLYFNRKIIIDSEGYIICNPNNLKWMNFSMLNKMDIKNENCLTKYWYINKNVIDICKKCEFRNLCIDPRVPEKRTDNSWFYKTECNYNPFIVKWKDENDYINLKDCGVKCDHDYYFEDQTQIRKIQKSIWA